MGDNIVRLDFFLSLFISAIAFGATAHIYMAMSDLFDRFIRRLAPNSIFAAMEPILSLAFLGIAGSIFTALLSGTTLALYSMQFAVLSSMIISPLFITAFRVVAPRFSHSRSGGFLIDIFPGMLAGLMAYSALVQTLASPPILLRWAALLFGLMGVLVELRISNPLALGAAGAVAMALVSPNVVHIASVFLGISFCEFLHQRIYGRTITSQSSPS